MDLQPTEIPALRSSGDVRPAAFLAAAQVAVLVVDDSPGRLTALAAVVTGMGLDAVTAGSGRDALRHLLQQDFALVLLDVNMPGMDGYETAALIHSRPRSSHTPIIFVTAEAGSEAQAYKGYALGAVDYVFSPIVPETLRAKIQVFVDLFYLNHQLKNQAEELQRHAEEITRKNLQLEAASRIKSEFLANMSHELRTPLNAIIGFSELLKDGVVGALTKKQKDYVKEIFTSGEHLLALINDILDLSKVETGKMSLDLEAVEVVELLQASLNVVRERAYKHRIKLRLELPDDAGHVLADARKLKQIMFNLLSNAVKFTPDGGEVRVASRAVRREELRLAALDGGAVRQLPLPDCQHERFLEITVSDSGTGITAADLPRLFRAFTQLESSSSRTSEGTGLGLALVARLAELHGGTVAVSSAPGRGSSFAVWLPWLDAPEEEESQTVVPHQVASDIGESPHAVPETETMASAPHRRALIIEDDGPAAAILRAQLETEGFHVLTASDAVGGLERAAQERPDLIVLDLLLPDMHGWEALDRIKADPVLRAIPVVMVSVIADDTQGFALGVAKVLQKPVSRKALRDALGELGLAGEQGQAISVLVVGGASTAVRRIETGLQGINCMVVGASDEETLNRVAGICPNIVILDFEMSNANGFAIMAALQANRATVDVPVFVVADKTFSKARRKRLEGYLSQAVKQGSFAPERRLVEVRRALRGRR